MCLIDNKKFRIALLPIKCKKAIRVNQSELRGWLLQDHIYKKSRIISSDNYKKPEKISKNNYKYSDGFIHAFCIEKINFKGVPYTVGDNHFIIYVNCIIPPFTRYGITSNTDLAIPTICARRIIICKEDYKKLIELCV